MARLFPDSQAAEQDYFRRTGIFPIMHLVVVRSELLAKHSDLAERIYRAFCAAKDAVMNQYKLGQIFNNMATMAPWFTQLLGETRQLMGDDWWPYGVKANRPWIRFCVIISSRDFRKVPDVRGNFCTPSVGYMIYLGSRIVWVARSSSSGVAPKCFSYGTFRTFQPL